jgi:hypothetical protein
MRSSRKIYWGIAGVLGTLIVAVVIITTFVLPNTIEGLSPPPPPTNPSPPDIPPPPDFDAREFIRQAREDGLIRSTRGPSTAGSVISIAGKDVKLPDNTYIEKRWYTEFCRKDCPVNPVYKLRRGESTVWVDSAGKMWDEDIADGRVDAFNFFREAVR